MSSELSVLHVINGLGTGGAERSLAEMLPRLMDRSVQPRIATLYRRDEGVEAIVRRLDIPVDVLPGSALGRLRVLRRIISEHVPDLIHTAIFESDVWGRLAAIGSGVPVLTSLVNTSYEPVRLADPAISGWKLRGAHLVDRFTARHLTAHFHAISHTVKEAAVRDMRLEPDRIAVIERGRDPDRLGTPGEERRQRARQALALSGDRQVVLSVGRQEFQKGQRHLLDAASRLVASRPNLVFLLAGRSGNASEELVRLRDKFGLDERFRFLGHRDDVPDLLAAADLFVFPSLYEGLGGAVIEAMALGLPVVATDIPAMREVLDPDRGAILIPPGDPISLANAIVSLLDDPDRRKAFGLWNRQVFLERFTLDRAVERMADLFRQVAAAGRDPGGRNLEVTDVHHPGAGDPLHS